MRYYSAQSGREESAFPQGEFMKRLRILVLGP